MKVRLIVQLLFLGYCEGYRLYHKDNKIKIPKGEPKGILFWMTICLIFPLVIMRGEFMDKLDNIKK